MTKRHFAVLALLLATGFIIAGCGGGGGGGAGGITINPPSITLLPGGTQTFSASTSVTWSVVESAGGTINPATGAYTAPTVTGTYHVRATSTADPTQTATATVTVQSSITVTISPSAVTLSPGQKQQFTSNTSVNWSVQEFGGGTINEFGLYTAPGGTGTFHVIATSKADSSKRATATVTVQGTVTEVVITPRSARLTPGGTQMFTANMTVTWQAEPGGGSISSSGLYVAPSQTGIYAVVATSADDTNKTGIAAVFVEAGTPMTLIVWPDEPWCVSPGKTLICSANMPVNWSILQTNGGTITVLTEYDGLYRAPSVSSSTPFTIRATSKADPLKTATITVLTDCPPIP